MKHLLSLVLMMISGLSVSLYTTATPAQDVPAADAPVTDTPTPASAQETPAVDASTSAQAQDAEKKTAKKRSYRRLPLYFPLIINKQQRADVYRIQEEYGERIADLEAQLRALRKERDEKIMNVLTPEQRKTYDELKSKAQKSK
ncbi:MAG: hypothetical protein Q4C47_07095 [Planctomycetia bacterium]|nr:hypothetical protein [Planctomycetia bacterium]